MAMRTRRTGLTADRIHPRRQRCCSTGLARAGILVALFALLLADTLTAAPPAWACSCDVAPLEAEVERNDVVFAGEVTRIRDGGQDHQLGTGLREVRVDVERVWKGDLPEQVSVHTEKREASCGYTFDTARSFLVFVREDAQDRLRASLCSRTAPIEEAGEDLETLGVGYAPRQAGQQQPGDDTGPAPTGFDQVLYPVALGALLAAFAAAGVITWRRRT